MAPPDSRIGADLGARSRAGRGEAPARDMWRSVARSRFLALFLSSFVHCCGPWATHLHQCICRGMHVPSNPHQPASSESDDEAREPEERRGRHRLPIACILLHILCWMRECNCKSTRAVRTYASPDPSLAPPACPHRTHLHRRRQIRQQRHSHSVAVQTSWKSSVSSRPRVVLAPLAEVRT